MIKITPDDVIEFQEKPSEMHESILGDLKVEYRVERNDKIRVWVSSRLKSHWSNLFSEEVDSPSHHELRAMDSLTVFLVNLLKDLKPVIKKAILNELLKIRWFDEIGVKLYRPCSTCLNSDSNKDTLNQWCIECQGVGEVQMTVENPKVIEVDSSGYDIEKVVN